MAISHGGVSPTANESTFVNAIEYGVCREMLKESINDSGITYWNIALLLPNVVFLIFLSYHIGLFYRLFHQQQFPVVKVLLILVFLVCTVSVIRGFAATIIKTSSPDGTLSNEVLWLLLRFLLLAVEISVIGFGLFGYGSGQKNGVGKRVLSLSFFLALVYTTIQSCFEVFAPNRAKIFKNKYMMFHHGGMLFWFVSSSLFFVIYSCVAILPKTNWLCGRGYLSLPSNRAFYRYATVLCLVNLLQMIGSMLVYNWKTVGLCILNVSVLVYYSLFIPLVYFTFLRKSFNYLKKSSSRSGINVSGAGSQSSSSEETNGTLIV